MTALSDQPLLFLPAEIADAQEMAFVVIIRTREQFLHWLRESASGLQWLQVEGLLGDPEPWAAAAQGDGDVSLDVVLADPQAEFAQLYRLVDVRATRDVRVTIPATPGFLKAVRLAASLGLPIRVLPGQPSVETVAQLNEAAEFYLGDPMVQAPLEPFHSLLAGMRGAASGTLWTILEDDPAIFAHHDTSSRTILPRTTHAAPPEFVAEHLAGLLAENAECTTCPWQQACAGYFKWPARDYACIHVKTLFAHIHAAAEEIGRELAAFENHES